MNPIYQAKTISGRGEGKKLGFPTINIDIPNNFQAETGVYAGWIWLDENQAIAYPAAIHYGPIPSFQINQYSLEAHVINQNIIKEPAIIKIQLTEKIREIKKFEDMASLSAQIREDVEIVKEKLKVL